MSMAPNASAVTIIEQIHSRTLPTLRERGIHNGTVMVEGIIYVNTMSGPSSGRPITYWATYSVSTPIVALPICSMNVTMINSLA